MNRLQQIYSLMTVNWLSKFTMHRGLMVRKGKEGTVACQADREKESRVEIGKRKLQSQGKESKRS